MAEDSILFLSHTEPDGSLSKASLEVLGAATALGRSLGGSRLTVGLIGEDVQRAADGIAECEATSFLAATGPDFAHPRYASDATAAEAICRAAGASLVVTPATSRWNRMLSGVAFRLGGRADTHVTAVSVTEGRPVVSRWYYRQRMEAQQQRTHRPWLLSIDPGCSQVWTGDSGKAQIEEVPISRQDSDWRTTFERIQAPAADEQTIRPDAEMLLVAGAGWTKPQKDGMVHSSEAEDLIRNFLRLTRASLGGSKSLVEQGGENQAVLSFMTHLHQVGQTGTTPRHPKGFSTCCHGEEPHVVGWRFIGERRAINLNPNCGWAHGKADVLYVADAFAVMKKINSLLAETKEHSP